MMSSASVVRLHGLPIRRVGRWLIGVLVALLALLPADSVLAMTVDEVMDRFTRCGFQIGEPATIYAIDGSPTTFFRVWTEDAERGTRGLVVYVYANADAADTVFHVLASVDRLEGVSHHPTADNGPLLERGAGRSVWRENVAVAQLMPLTSPSDLDAVPDADLVRCLDDPSSWSVRRETQGRSGPAVIPTGARHERNGGVSTAAP